MERGKKESVSLKPCLVQFSVTWLCAWKPNERAHREVQTSYENVLIPLTVGLQVKPRRRRIFILKAQRKISVGDKWGACVLVSTLGCMWGISVKYLIWTGRCAPCTVEPLTEWSSNLLFFCNLPAQKCSKVSYCSPYTVRKDDNEILI